MTLYLFIYTAQLLVSMFLKASNPGMHAGRPPSHSAHLAPSFQDEHSDVCGQGLQAAFQHPTRHLLLSLTKQWLITERHFTQY